jgi:hypothetical protein
MTRADLEYQVAVIDGWRSEASASHAAAQNNGAERRRNLATAETEATRLAQASQRQRQNATQRHEALVYAIQYTGPSR